MDLATKRTKRCHRIPATELFATTHQQTCSSDNKKSRTYGTSDLPLRPPTSASHFGLPLWPPTSDSHGLPPRTPTASHFGLPLQPPTSASHFGLPPQTPTSDSHLRLPWPPTASHHVRGSTTSLIGSDRSHDKMWEALCERVRISGRSWEAVLPDWLRVRGHVRGQVRGHVRAHVRGHVGGHVRGHGRGHGSPRWEAVRV